MRERDGEEGDRKWEGEEIGGVGEVRKKEERGDGREMEEKEGGERKRNRRGEGGCGRCYT